MGIFFVDASPVYARVLLFTKDAFSLETSSAAPRGSFVVGFAVACGILAYRSLQKQLKNVFLASRLRGRARF